MARRPAPGGRLRGSCRGSAPALNRRPALRLPLCHATGSFEAAFQAAADVAKEEAQKEDDNYDEAKWNECKDAGFGAMQNALANGEQDPGKVFGAVLMGIVACGEAQQGTNQD